MKKCISITIVAITLVCNALLATAHQAQSGLLVRQHHPFLVVSEHLDALNQCDVDRLMAQYPPGILILLGGGQTIQGRPNTQELFEGFCLSPSEGGLNGITFTEVASWKVGKTVNVQWSADACFLTETYLGADAYITQNGLMAAMVTTFDGAELSIDETKLDCVDE